MDILRRHSAELVAAHVRDGSVLIELGVGSMRKTRFLLDAIAESGKQVTAQRCSGVAAALAAPPPPPRLLRPTHCDDNDDEERQMISALFANANMRGCL